MGRMNNKYTQRQGQYLAFIYYYTKIHGYAPAEADLQKYFKVSPPSVHQMVITLEKNGLIIKITRSTSVYIPIIAKGRTARSGMIKSIEK